MGRYLKSLRLKGLQSWKDETLDFTDKLNVIQGHNETGKSVPFKIMRQMCFSSMYGRASRKSLIRRGCEFGEAWFTYNDCVVKFEIYNTYQIYRLYDNDGKEVQSWQRDSMPQKLLDIVGWYINEDNNILLNLLDQEIPLPFAESSLKFNAEVLKFITESPELERAKENFKEWVQELYLCKGKENTNLATLVGLSNNYKYENLEDYRDMIDKKTNVLNMCGFFKELFEKLTNLAVTGLGEFKFKDKEKIETIINTKNALYGVNKILTKHLAVENPKDISIDKELLSSVIDVNKSLRDIKGKIDSVSNQHKLLKEYYIKPVDTDKIEKILETKKNLGLLRFKLGQYCDFKSKNATLEIQLNRLSVILDDCRDKLGVCPLCGSDIRVNK